MRLVQFINKGEHKDRQRLGVQLCEDGDIVDVNSFHPSLPRDMREFIAGGEASLEIAAKAVQSGTSHVVSGNDITLLPAISTPGKVMCVGMNYADHCQELNMPLPTEPVTFSKFNSAITGPTDDIQHPELTQELDWEVELAVVIGKKGKNIQREAAMGHVFGYTVVNDVSARDWMRRNGKQVLIGKSLDGLCPLGPAIVTKEDIPDPHVLRVWTTVNGEVKQDSNTRHLIFDIPHLIGFLSRFFTLQPGDVILTGTPAGTGVSRRPQVFLQQGDLLETGIEGIGKLKNKIV